MLDRLQTPAVSSSNKKLFLILHSAYFRIEGRNLQAQPANPARPTAIRFSVAPVSGVENAKSPIKLVPVLPINVSTPVIGSTVKSSCRSPLPPKIVPSERTP